MKMPYSSYLITFCVYGGNRSLLAAFCINRSSSNRTQSHSGRARQAIPLSATEKPTTIDCLKIATKQIHSQISLLKRTAKIVLLWPFDLLHPHPRILSKCLRIRMNDNSPNRTLLHSTNYLTNLSGYVCLNGNMKRYRYLFQLHLSLLGKSEDSQEVIVLVAALAGEISLMNSPATVPRCETPHSP